ncbi:MAG: hypothetical protein DMD96_00440 [Candidatus Rokuibacteriota bacterium]|nr:MAG: hypothetical protein DMD96_00440 [Candidatus Rokubacteria bacterium]
MPPQSVIDQGTCASINWKAFSLRSARRVPMVRPAIKDDRDLLIVREDSFEMLVVVESIARHDEEQVPAGNGFRWSLAHTTLRQRVSGHAARRRQGPCQPRKLMSGGRVSRIIIGETGAR